jgi:2-hydroxychromene-2-carboxylate isomerase
MSDHIDFYFDIIGSYSYITNKKIQKIREIKKIKFNYKPFLLGVLHKLVEIITPTFVINIKIFWGQDRFEYALNELNNS